MNAETQFVNLYSGNQQGYGVYDPKMDKYKFIHEMPTVDVIEQHLSGKRSIGIVPIRRDNTALFGTIDHDPHHKKPEGYKYPFATLQKKINFLDLPLVVTKSKRDGAHITLFLKRPYPANEVQHMMKKFAYTLFGTKDLEIFPKQIELGAGEDGSFINLPYKGGNSRVMLNSEGKELNLQEAMEYSASRVHTLEDLKPFKLLAKKDFPEGRNNKTHQAGVYLKKHFPKDYEDLIKEYNKLFNADDKEGVLSDRELKSTILKSLGRKDYTHDIPEGTPKNKPDPTAWRMGTHLQYRLTFFQFQQTYCSP